MIKTITLLGSMEARNQGKCLLENHPSVRRIDMCSSDMQMKILLRCELSDLKVLAMLEDSGLSGVVFHNNKRQQS